MADKQSKFAHWKFITHIYLELKSISPSGLYWFSVLEWLEVSFSQHEEVEIWHYITMFFKTWFCSHKVQGPSQLLVFLSKKQLNVYLRSRLSYCSKDYQARLTGASDLLSRS